MERLLSRPDKAGRPFAVRPMALDDIGAVSELSEVRQWPHHREDWERFHDLGEGLVAEQDGKPIGAIMAWRHGEDMAGMGMLVVGPAAQSEAIGRKLMEEMVGRLGDRTIVCHASEDDAPLCRELGFTQVGSVRQHHGLVRDVPVAQLQPGERVRPFGKADTNLASLYSMASGMDRTRLLAALAGTSRTFVISRENEAVGFAMLRRFGSGWSIAPVVAPDAHGAKALMLHGLAEKAGRFCRVDLTAESGLSSWLEELGLPCVGVVRTMVRGTAPVTGATARVFAVAAQGLA